MSDQPVGYQLRHRRFGIFQGECMGMAFWYDDANPTPEMMPEQGYLEFRTYDEAAAFRAFLCSQACEQPLHFDDLAIEPFDFEASERLKTSVA